MAISVALASFNGEKFIGEQIASILAQEKAVSEIVVSDDGSEDRTIQRIEESVEGANLNLKILKQTSRLGVNGNFLNALKHVSGDLIFLSDQDDFWLPSKTKVVSKVLGVGPTSLAIHDLSICDESLKVIHESATERYETLSVDSWRSPGCCMAFTADLLQWVLRLPVEYPYDHLIRLTAARFGKVVRLEDVLTLYRRHDTNHSCWLPDSTSDLDFLKRYKFRTRLYANGVLSMLGVPSSRRTNIRFLEHQINLLFADPT